MKNLHVITGYGETEEDGTVCPYGDYHYIKVIDADTGEQILWYGDSYHDKGQEKLEGFIDGLLYSKIDYKITRSDELAEGY